MAPLTPTAPSSRNLTLRELKAALAGLPGWSIGRRRELTWSQRLASPALAAALARVSLDVALRTGMLPELFLCCCRLTLTLGAPDATGITAPVLEAARLTQRALVKVQVGLRLGWGEADTGEIPQPADPDPEADSSPRCADGQL